MFVKFTKFVSIPVLKNTAGRLLLIIAASVVVVELANKTVNYDAATKPEVQVIKRGSP